MFKIIYVFEFLSLMPIALHVEYINWILSGFFVSTECTSDIGHGSGWTFGHTFSRTSAQTCRRSCGKTFCRNADRTSRRTACQTFRQGSGRPCRWNAGWTCCPFFGSSRTVSVCRWSPFQLSSALTRSDWILLQFAKNEIQKQWIDFSRPVPVSSDASRDIFESPEETRITATHQLILIILTI